MSLGQLATWSLSSSIQDRRELLPPPLIITAVLTLQHCLGSVPDWLFLFYLHDHPCIFASEESSPEWAGQGLKVACLLPSCFLRLGLYTVSAQKSRTSTPPTPGASES